MYECPITKYMSDIQEQIDEQIEEQLMIGVKRSIGFDINKDELIKALKYDREQYSKGYKDGKIEILENIKQAREKIKELSQFGLLVEKSEVLDIFDTLIAESEG